jgi:hypothetical protein
MSARQPAASRVLFGVLASALAALLASPAPARINLGDGPIGGGPIVIGPIDPGDGGGGGGGGGGSQTSAWLEAHGYVCRPYFDGILNGKRCEITYIEETTFTAVYELQRCDPNDSCSRRATKRFRGKAASGFSLWSFKFPGAPKASGYGDLDNDGDDDLVAFWGLESSAGQVRVALSNHANEFSQVPLLWASGFCSASTQECAVGDFSGDHKADIVAIDRGNGQVTVATSSGSAFVSPRVWSSTFGAIPGQLMVGDFDGDGAKDLATILTANGAWGSRGTVVVALSVPGPPILTQSSARSAGALAGELTATATEFATLSTVATKAGGAAALFPGGPIGGIGGPRVFAAPTVWSGAICPDPNECIVGDFDGDLKDDVLWVRATGESYFARSTGTAFVGQENWSDRVGRNPRTFRAADMNADGKDDLVAIQTDGGLTVGFSNGTAFVANVNVDDMNCGDPQFGCQFASVNGDAYPDLVEIYPFGDSQLRPGDTFVSKGVEPRGFPADPARPEPADADGDGVRDEADDCISVANAAQTDADGDGVGDVCELSGDINNDGVVDLADRFELLIHLNQAYPPADLNGDGTVNAQDLAILDQQRALPNPSATTGIPKIDLVAPRNGTFYEPGTRRVYVAGFARNVSSQNGTLTVRSQTYPGTSVDTTLAIARDGWFEGFVPVHTQTELNPIVVKALRPSTFTPGFARAVALIGPSAAIGDFASSSLGARIQSWELSALAEEARVAVNLDEMAAEAAGGDVKSVSITGPLSLAIRPWSDRITVDIGFPAMHVDYEDFLSGCNVPMNMTGIQAHIEYDLEPRYMYPDQVAAKDLPESPSVTFASFSSGEHVGCSALAGITDTDIRNEAERALELALAAGDFQPGPVDGKLEDKINALDLSQALASLGVVIGTRFRSVPEDIVGVTFDLDSAYAPSAMCGTEICHPPLTNATPRAFQTGVARPPFPLWIPEGGNYDVALALSADTINHLFNAMAASGELADLMAERTIDLSEYADTLAEDNLGATMKIVPTLAPFLTGRPGANGGTEVKIGQLLLEIPSLVNSDVFRIALDLKGEVSFGLESRFAYLGFPPTILAIRVHDLEVLGAENTHVPDGTSPFLWNVLRNDLVPQIALQTLAIRYPLPDFGGSGLKLLALDAKPNGGAVVYANLHTPYPGGGGGGPVIDVGGVFEVDPVDPGPGGGLGPVLGGGVIVNGGVLEVEPATGGGLGPVFDGGILTGTRTPVGVGVLRQP